MRILVLVAVLALAGCQERYRYPCQDPANFGKEECQRPLCQFSQQCPEYLVAPILEKQVDASREAPKDANGPPKAHPK